MLSPAWRRPEPRYETSPMAKFPTLLSSPVGVLTGRHVAEAFAVVRKAETVVITRRPDNI
jgi:hypothetical protein